MKTKFALRLSYLAIIVTLLLQSCEDKSSFGEDLQGAVFPTEITYPDILNAREFVEVESAAPFLNTNGHPVTFELVSIKKGEEMLDASYLSDVSIKNYSVIESKVRDASDTLNPYTIYTKDLYEMGKITIAENDKFSNGEYFFTIKVSAEINGVMESNVFEDVLRLYIGPELVVGIAYCPFNMNFVSGESTTSNPVELIGGNPDIRFELGSESDKLSIDAVTGALSLNSSYTVSATEYLNPIINVVSNITDEAVSFEGTAVFSAVLSTAPVVLDKQNEYFFFPNLIPVSKDNLALGGDGWSRQVVEFDTTDDDWYNPKAVWQAATPPVDTPDALAVREESGVQWTQRLQIPWWTMENQHDSWVVIDAQNLALYQGCFDSKVVFWYNLYFDKDQTNNGYEEDGSTPIAFEVKISTNYTGDVTTTDWTPVNDILECEINDNGTIFTGMPYPGNQKGLNPDGLKDLTKNANKKWVRGELNLEDYKTEEAFTIAFRIKTYFDGDTPYTVNKWNANGMKGFIRLSNVHFVATEK